MSIFSNEGKKIQIYYISHQCHYHQFCDTSRCKCKWFFFSSFRYYQIRTALKTAPKVPVKTEVSLPHNSGISQELRYFLDVVVVFSVHNVSVLIAHTLVCFRLLKERKEWSEYMLLALI